MRTLTLGIGLVLSAWLPLLAAGTPDIRPDKYIHDVRYLSSPALEGRGTGSAGLDKAARYIAQRFAKAGLQPLGQNGFFQPFPVSVSSTLGPANGMSYKCGTEEHLLPSEDFLPFNFSGEGNLTGPVVFAGYGITAPEYSYDDYASIDVRGKIVVVLRHEPQEYNGSSVFEGRIYTEHSQWFSKAWNARIHGARAMLVVTDTVNHSADSLEAFLSLVGPADPGIPVVQMKAGVLESWFQLASRNFKESQEAIDRDLKPQSFAFPDSLSASLSVHVQHVSRNVNNVVGYLPGETSEYIIIGAHYDHLGHGEQYSMAPGLVGTSHPGADDNASGTAGLVALAKWFGSQPKQKRGIVFLAFAGEELGLLGSSYYVNHSLLPLNSAVLMINMDMIGRIREGKVLVTGATAGSDIRNTLDRLQSTYDLHLQMDDGGVYGSSDHTSFQTKLIPILFFFSGLHSDYHKPSDTWDKIDGRHAARLLQLIAELVVHVTDQPPKSQFVHTSATPQPAVEWYK